MKVVVIYDISNDKKRNKLAKELFRYGFRVQYSVFEVEVTKREFLKLEELAFKFSTDKDKVTLYKYTTVQRIGKVEFEEESSLIF